MGKLYPVDWQCYGLNKEAVYHRNAFYREEEKSSFNKDKYNACKDITLELGKIKRTLEKN